MALNAELMPLLWRSLVDEWRGLSHDLAADIQILIFHADEIVLSKSLATIEK